MSPGNELYVAGANLHFRTFPVNPNLQEGLRLNIRLVSLSLSLSLSLSPSLFLSLLQYATL
jgi:hypothetical protein